MDTLSDLYRPTTSMDLYAMQSSARSIMEAAIEMRVLRVQGQTSPTMEDVAQRALHELIASFGLELRQRSTNSLPSERALSADDRADRDHQSAREERL